MQPYSILYPKLSLNAEMVKIMNIQTMFVYNFSSLGKIYQNVHAVSFKNCILWKLCFFCWQLCHFLGNFHNFFYDILVILQHKIMAICALLLGQITLGTKHVCVKLLSFSMSA